MDKLSSSRGIVLRNNADTVFDERVVRSMWYLEWSNDVSWQWLEVPVNVCFESVHARMISVWSRYGINLVTVITSEGLFGSAGLLEILSSLVLSEQIQERIFQKIQCSLTSPENIRGILS